MLKMAIWLNVGLRALMETGVVAGFAAWGYRFGSTAWSSLLLAIALPAIGFGIWGLIDFRSAGNYAEGLRLAEELVISGLAALAFYGAGHPILGWSLAAVSVVHHGLIYLTGQRLLTA